MPSRMAGPRRLIPIVVLALAACWRPVLAGSADLKLKDLIVAQAATAEDFQALLASDVEVHRAAATVRGTRAGAELLRAVEPGGATRLLRHHDVSLLVLGDGRVLFISRSADDRVTRAIELRAPARTDGLPWQAVYYDKVWNSDDAEVRRALLNAMWAEHGRYVDPLADVEGPEAVGKMIGNFRFLYPGAQVSATSGVADCGGGWLTFDWVITSRLGGRTLYTGFDVAHLTADGKLELLAGFFGKRN
jgi:hypothetical protein